MAKTINGQQIERLSTIDSMYAKGHILAHVGDTQYKIHVDELIKNINGIEFDVETKQVWSYLTVKESTVNTDGLGTYYVTCRNASDDPGDDNFWIFTCWAENEDHAIEQAEGHSSDTIALIAHAG